MRAQGAHLSGQLDLRDAKLTNEGGCALHLDHAEVDGSAFLGGLFATGEVRAVGARIRGQLDLHGAKLTNEGGRALSLDPADVDGSAFLRDRRPAPGWLNLTRAQIGDLVVDNWPLGGLPGPLVASGWQVQDMH